MVRLVLLILRLRHSRSCLRRKRGSCQVECVVMTCVVRICCFGFFCRSWLLCLSSPQRKAASTPSGYPHCDCGRCGYQRKCKSQIATTYAFFRGGFAVLAVTSQVRITPMQPLCSRCGVRRHEEVASDHELGLGPPPFSMYVMLMGFRLFS